MMRRLLPLVASNVSSIILFLLVGTATAQLPQRAMVDMLTIASRPSGGYWWPVDSGASMGLVAWLRADQGLYHSNGVEILAANNNATNMAPIKIWSNQVYSAAWNTNWNGVNWASVGMFGAYYHPANSTALNSGNVSVQGNGNATSASGQYLRATAANAAPSWTIFLMFAFSPTNQSKQRMMLDSFNSDARLRFDKDPGIGPYFQPNGSLLLTFGLPGYTNTWGTAMFQKTDSTHIWVRTNSVNVTTNYSTTGLSAAATLNLNMDTLDGGGYPGDSYIYELLIYNSALNYGSVQAVESYLSRRKSGTQ